MFRTDDERRDASVMVNPIASPKMFAYFGYILGTLTPAAMAIKMLTESGTLRSLHVIFLMLLMTAGVTSGLVAYATGRHVPRLLATSRNFALPNNLLWISLMGALWGAASGAAGGLLLFVVGAIPAGIFGAAVGAISVPILFFFYEKLRRGDAIEVRHFLPVALGITLCWCAFILGF